MKITQIAYKDIQTVQVPSAQVKVVYRDGMLHLEKEGRIVLSVPIQSVVSVLEHDQSDIVRPGTTQ